MFCLLHAALAAQRGWTCNLVHRAEEVFKSTKGDLSTYLCSNTFENLLTKPSLHKGIGQISVWSLSPFQQQMAFAKIATHHFRRDAATSQLNE